MSLICEPIGLIHTNKKVKFDTPHQPQNDVSEQNIIELFPGQRFENGLRDLEGFERIWLVWWFDRNSNWRPLVTPPRGDGKRRGVFATRSPHRPCPIGMTAVPLLSIAGRELTVGNVDLLDKTPILDIKPYISTIDSFPNQRQGWLEDVEKNDLPAQYSIKISELADEQLAWLNNEWNINFFAKSRFILERAPFKSRTHRITSAKNGIFRLSSGAWRIFFSVEANLVQVMRVAPGYPRSLLLKDGFEIIPDWQAQIKFGEIWRQDLP